MSKIDSMGIISKIVSGKNIIEIAKDYGVSKQRIGQIMSERNINYQLLRHGATHEEIVERYVECSYDNVEALAKKYKYSRTGIVKILQRAEKYDPNKPDEIERIILDDMSAGMTDGEIAEKNGIAKSKVYYTRRKYNVHPNKQERFEIEKEPTAEIRFNDFYSGIYGTEIEGISEELDISLGRVADLLVRNTNIGTFNMTKRILEIIYDMAMLYQDRDLISELVVSKYDG